MVFCVLCASWCWVVFTLKHYLHVYPSTPASHICMLNARNPMFAWVLDAPTTLFRPTGIKNNPSPPSYSSLADVLEGGGFFCLKSITSENTYSTIHSHSKHTLPLLCVWGCSSGYEALRQWGLVFILCGSGLHQLQCALDYQYLMTKNVLIMMNDGVLVDATISEFVP